MKLSFTSARLMAAGGFLLAGSVLVADGTRFSDFTPLAASAGPTVTEDAPLTLGNPEFRQESIANRHAQLSALKPNGVAAANNASAWDMNTLNETGRRKGRFLFTVFEEDWAGVQRHDLKTGETDTIWVGPTAAAADSFDPSFWTPWGTFITAEESWGVAAGGFNSPYGRLFEFKNPTTAPGIYTPVTAFSNAGAKFTHKNVIPRTAHEGIQFDEDGNMYFIDELNGGNIYKYTPKASFKRVLDGKADYFAAGTTYVMRVGNGLTPNAVGAYTWVPFTDNAGKGLPGALTITDSNGVTSVDASNTTNLAAFKGTDYQRPEDIQIQTLEGRQYLYFTTTTTSEVYRVDLGHNTISLFASRATIDLATGLPVGTQLTSPDNLAVDHEGNIYIVEDQAGGVNCDIWFAKDLNKDGDLLDAGEGIGRWASNGTPGSEFTGLYFDPFNKRRAWVNIQHPSSGNDRTIEITIRGGHYDDEQNDDRGHDDSDDDRDYDDRD
ncbi:MAG: alkaline phosphatase PhoX [Vicinamibacterales bacterium]